MSDKLYFGTGRRCITPKVPVSLAGYFNLRMWDQVLDDLEVRALALKQGEKNFLLVQFDLITVNEVVYLKLRKAIADLAQFNDGNIIFTATHTHTAPDINPTSNGSNPEYTDFAVAQAEAAIRDAVKHMRAGELATGLTGDKRFEFNRRYWMKDGSVVTNPGKLNPKIVRPEGAVDYDIPLAALCVNGKVEVLLANIVNHTDTTGGSGVSADWVGFTRRELENQLGKESMVMPLIGCAGNINHFDVSTAMNQTCCEEPARIGRGYAETISAALPTLAPAGAVELKTSFRAVTVGPCDISEQELTEARAVIARYPEVPDPFNSDVALTSEDLANGAPVALKYFAGSVLKAYEDRADRTFRLVGMSLGPLVVASLPSEPFVEIGLDIRKRFFDDRLCMVLSHCNGTGAKDNGGGYIPNAWNYGRGGYETTSRSNPFARNTSEKFRASWTCVEQAKEL